MARCDIVDDRDFLLDEDWEHIKTETEKSQKPLPVYRFFCSLGFCPYVEPYLVDGEDGLTCEECTYCEELS